MKLMTFAVSLSACLALAPAAHGATASDYYLKWDGGNIKGASVTKLHKDATELLAFSWGMSIAPTLGSGGGGGGASKPSFQDLAWVQDLDRAVPTLMMEAAKGTTFAGLTSVYAVSRSDPTYDYLTLDFTDAQITSISMNASSGNGVTVQGTFAYSKIKMTVKVKDEAGKITPYEGTWDVTGGAFSGSPVAFLQLANMSAPVSYEMAAALVPEPETYALMFSGLALVGWMAGRRKQA